MADTKTVFVVEDNELNLKLFRDLLLSQNYEVIDTKDGNVAVDMLREHMPDLVIMDIQLHGISGFDLIRDIKSDDTLSHIPIIAVTAFAMKDDRDRIMETGCEAYLSKPIAITEFFDLVNGFLRETD